jgi:hypothetical protein
MWYTPMDGTYACQQVQCQVTVPINEHGSFKPEEDYMASAHYWTAANTPLENTPLHNYARMEAKTRWLHTPPNEFFRGYH